MILYKKDPPELESMSKVIINRNKDLNWVKRGLELKTNPNFKRINNKDGSYSTHKLAYSTGDNGEAYVYPTIIEQNGKLKELTGREAWDYAKRNNSAIKFSNIKLAEYFSENGLIKH